MIDARTRDMFYKLKASHSDKQPNTSEFNKNLKIELLHEEFHQSQITFEEYFEKLTHQMLNPYEQYLDCNNDIEIEQVEEVVANMEESTNVRFKTDKEIGSFDSICFWPTSKIQKLMSEQAQVCIDPSTDQMFVLNVNNNHWILLTNIDPYDPFTENADLINRKWFVYDSLNNLQDLKPIKRVMTFLYPECIIMST
ncbi:unnamed protein product [Brachionus calyciflorus]|uniref:Uncharacterized protein n=1 Tax=Brachionus calyciflorus TaxID=104777 RepID=A0A814R0C6_9BILA|nr:unnamed protein product [Brachionus calyciflorus]